MLDLTRNPIIDGGQYIGDPHLGRTFVNRVHLDKRGVIEAKQLALFKSLVLTVNPAVKFICVVGDLFDKLVVSNETVIAVGLILREAVLPVYLLHGNHDSSKNSAVMSSFDLLCALLVSNPNIHYVIKDVLQTPEGIVLIPWDYAETAQEKLERSGLQPEVVVTHLDRVSYGNDHNVIPTEYFRSIGVKQVINGHEHKPYKDDLVYCVGSMLPYSHAEGMPTESEYVTLTEADFQKPDFNPDDYKDSIVRVRVAEGTMIPQLNSLGIDIQYQITEADTQTLSTEFVGASLATLFTEAMTLAEVPTERQAEVWETLQNNTLED